jgi:hypothetical protein
MWCVLLVYSQKKQRIIREIFFLLEIQSVPDPACTDCSVVLICLCDV